MKDKQDAELDGEKLFLDYTDEKSKHVGKGEDKEFGMSLYKIWIHTQKIEILHCNNVFINNML